MKATLFSSSISANLGNAGGEWRQFYHVTVQRMTKNFVQRCQFGDCVGRASYSLHMKGQSPCVGEDRQ